jgi:hypothetical protein
VVEVVTVVGQVTVAEMVEGHVGLDLSCIDRLYLSGFVPGLQTPGGVIYFLHDHRGHPIASPALFEKIGNRFRVAMAAWARAHGVPVVTFTAGERKAEVMAPYLEAARARGRSGVVAIGRAQEYAPVWTARKRDTDPGKCPQFSFAKQQRRVSVFYVYIWDEQMGAGFIKICTYFPYPIKVWVNGHEWAKRQALAAGLGFRELSNGFASCQDPAALQEICDRFGPGVVQVWFQRWMAQLPLPLDPARDRDAGFWWELSMRQVEVSRTLVFDTDCRARGFFEALIAQNMDLGRPENVELLFRRGSRIGRPTNPPPGGFKTKIDQCCELVTLNVFYKHSRLKQYLKDGRALRIETVINDAHDLRCNRMLTNLDQLQGKARAINQQLLETETVGQGMALVSPVIERITTSTVTDDGRKAPALRFGDLRVQALAGAIATMLMAATGITNKTLRGLMTGLLSQPYGMNQASYDLARLRLNGLITKLPDRNRYTLTPDGLAFAHIYTKVYDHVLRPLMALDAPNAAPELIAALHTIDQITTERINQAHVPISRPRPPGPRPEHATDCSHRQQETEQLPSDKLMTIVKVRKPKVL